jgi:hypothetical protein
VRVAFVIPSEAKEPKCCHAGDPLLDAEHGGIAGAGEGRDEGEERHRRGAESTASRVLRIVSSSGYLKRAADVAAR